MTPLVKHQPEAQPAVQSMPLLPGVVIEYSVQVRGRRSMNAARTCSQWVGEIEAEFPMTLQQGLQSVLDHVLPQTGEVQAPRSIAVLVKVRNTSNTRRVRVQ
jgi:hypothetical protein